VQLQQKKCDESHEESDFQHLSGKTLFPMKYVVQEENEYLKIFIFTNGNYFRIDFIVFGVVKENFGISC